VLAVTSIKQPTCLEQQNNLFLNFNSDIHLYFAATSLKQPLFVLPLGGCLTQV